MHEETAAAKMSGIGLLQRSRAALLTGARSVSGSVGYDLRGYAPRWQDNLMPGLPLAEIERDLGAGAGRELDGKLRAAHSSAALAVNAFGPWRSDPGGVSLADLTGFQTMRFEAACPTGLGGTPPHLDLLARGEGIVAVESKCTEWMTTTDARFSPSYDRLRGSHGHSLWFELVGQLRLEPRQYRFIDAAQLVKHALGLLTCYGTREVRLVYLYWEPSNAADWPECRLHRAEADDLADRVKGSSVRLFPLSYNELWSQWATLRTPSHVPYLQARYHRAV
jgi:hypothetical protein